MMVSFPWKDSIAKFANLYILSLLTYLPLKLESFVTTQADKSMKSPRGTVWNGKQRGEMQTAAFTAA